MATAKIRVAIIGGGLGGTVLMNSLMKHSHIDAHIYEAKDTFKERGASVGLAGNAQRALKLMGLEKAVESGRAVSVNGARFFMGHGPDEGKLVLYKEGDLRTVHRAALLRELLDPIPEERMHVNKKVVRIDTEKNAITFEDGSVVTTDVIIGADGIHSSVRQCVLKDEHDRVSPIHAGIYDCRTLIPFEKALAELGPEILKPEDRRQTIYFGDGNLILFNHIEEGDIISLMIAGHIPADWDNKQWRHSISREFLLERFQNWPKFAKSMVNLLCGDSDEVSAFIEWESAPTTKIHNGTICLMGDAAHATTPWQAAGLGQAIEDALIIQTALGACRSLDDIPRAFEIYDQLMRPRGQEIIESSRFMGGLYLGKEGLNADRLREIIIPKWNFIHDWDTQGAVDSVVKSMQASRLNGVP